MEDAPAPITTDDVAATAATQVAAGPSPEEINSLPIFRYDGPVEVVSTPAAAASAVERLSREAQLGFDTETRPAFRKGQVYLPALVQLAAADRVYLFQLKQMGGLGPLAGLLASQAVLKAGIAVDRDLKDLQKLEAFVPDGFVDLGSAAKAAGLAKSGLRPLAAMFLGVRVSKGEQCSNWSRADLTPKQIVYAATDAWIGLQLLLEFRRRELALPLLKKAEPPAPDA